MFKLILKSHKLLDFEEKKKFYILFFLILVGFILEAASIGSIIPLLILLSENDSFFKIYFIEEFIFFQSLNEKQKLIFFVSIFFSLFFLKNLFLLFFNWYSSKFSTQLSINLANKLYKKYINQSYIFFIKNSSSSLLRNIITETKRFANNIIVTNANLILEILVLISISLILFFYDYKSFLFVVAVSIISFLILQLFTRKKLEEASKNRFLYEKKLINRVQTSFNLFKIIKVFVKNRIFHEIFFDDLKRYSYSIRNIQFINKIPRFIFEIVVIIAFSFLILFLLKNEKNNVDIITLLGLFVAAASRIFPAILRIVNSYQSLKSSRPSMQIIVSELKKNSDKKTNNNNNLNIVFKNQISLKNIYFKYANSDKYVFKNLNFKIKKNQIIGVVGPSGSGKSTLIDIVMGLIKADKGSILLDGKKLKKNDLKYLQKFVGYVPQGTFLIDDTIEKNIAFGANENSIDKEKIVSSAKNSQIHNYIKSLPRGYKTKIYEKGTNLSEGQKQRISLARALYFDPQILILDEATAALDMKTEKKFINYLKTLKKKKTIIIISHQYKILSICNKIFCFDFNNNFNEMKKKYIRKLT
tara:strand:+ start:2654 stop:4408 length:1755 start_codon:yes stop_codon:yes gene_type:complete